MKTCGDYNTGHYNLGDFNTGSYNTGNFNTGDYNIGNYNTGDYNTCDYSNGMFNTESPKIYMFNKPTEYTYIELHKKFSEALSLLYQLTAGTTLWVSVQDMTDEEKIQHPEYNIIGGYSKISNPKDTYKANWKEFSIRQRDLIKSLPNFDKEIFKEITGITV